MFSLSPCNTPRGKHEYVRERNGARYRRRETMPDSEFKIWTVCIKCGEAWSHFTFSWNQGEVCPECDACCSYRTQIIARKVRLWGYAGKWNLWGWLFGQKMWETIEGAHVHSLGELFNDKS